MGRLLWVVGGAALLLGCAEGMNDGESGPGGLSDANIDSVAGPAVAGRGELAARVKSISEGEALVADPVYQSARRDSAEEYRNSRQSLIGRLALRAEDAARLAAILAEHDAARLEMMDFYRRTRGMSREEREEMRKKTVGVSPDALLKSSPLWIQERVRAVLSKQGLAQFQSALTTDLLWDNK